MSDQEGVNGSGGFSPEHVSLEKRFVSQEKTDGGAQPEKEAAQETAHEKSGAEKDATYSKILSKVTSTVKSDDDEVMSDASDLDQKTDRESQITHLIDLAMTKGVVHAVDVARKAEDYYLLDQLHDRLLADDLHDALVQKGFIEE